MALACRAERVSAPRFHTDSEPHEPLTMASMKGKAARYRKALLVLLPTDSSTWCSLLMM